jgi:hypothetical protein
MDDAVAWLSGETPESLVSIYGDDRPPTPTPARS